MYFPKKVMFYIDYPYTAHAQEYIGSQVALLVAVYFAGKLLFHTGCPHVKCARLSNTVTHVWFVGKVTYCTFVHAICTESRFTLFW